MPRHIITEEDENLHMEFTCEITVHRVAKSKYSFTSGSMYRDNLTCLNKCANNLGVKQNIFTF